MNKKTVMECSELNCMLNCRHSYSFIRKRRKFITLQTIYAGLILLFVPEILCDPEWVNHLSYDKIFNNTIYAQIQYNKTRPYSPITYSFNQVLDDNKKISYFDDINNGNDIEYEEYDMKNYNGQLLVGFSHDPFRYSIPKNDYLKGVRNIDPQTYMNKGENRGKRGVVHLYNMMYCATGCEPLAYKGYGCYCGFLGSGRPTDGIDRCCKIHDQCYENIFCPFYTVYFQPYLWKCYRGEPLCAIENQQTKNSFVNGCAARLCECDRQFAMCIKKYRCPRRRALCHSSPLRLLQNLLMFK